jgi:hypothetical protein
VNSRISGVNVSHSLLLDWSAKLSHQGLRVARLLKISRDVKTEREVVIKNAAGVWAPHFAFGDNR